MKKYCAWREGDTLPAHADTLLCDSRNWYTYVFVNSLSVAVLLYLEPSFRTSTVPLLEEFHQIMMIIMIIMASPTCYSGSTGCPGIPDCVVRELRQCFE